MHRIVCALWRQHEASMLIITEDGLYLRCPDCGWCSPGWDLTAPTMPKVAVDRGVTNRSGFERSL